MRIQKCGVEVTVLEARASHGGRCIAAHSSSTLSSNGGDGVEASACGNHNGPWHLGELAPLPLALRPKGMLKRVHFCECVCLCVCAHLHLGSKGMWEHVFLHVYVHSVQGHFV